MKIAIRLFVSIFLLLVSSPVFSQTSKIVSHSDWGEIFEKASVKGTIVFKFMDEDQLHVFNETRAQDRKLPASTFKVIHSLIAYETGVVTRANHLFKWDGKPQWLKAWEKDLTFKEAIKVSAVPVYKRVARSIGSKQMGNWLKRLNYGNKSIEGGIDQFWLSGGLRISAIEQVRFLEKLYKGELDASQEGQAFVRDLMPLSKHKCFETRDKTGLAFRKGSPHIGWWIGWAKASQKIIFFALNIDITDKKQYGLRQSIVISLLEQARLFKGISCKS